MSKITETANDTQTTCRKSREPRNRRSKERSTSSLAGMFLETEIKPRSNNVVDIMTTVQQYSSLSAADTAISAIDDNSKYSDVEKQQLAEICRKLRQAKRRLFLKSAVPASDSVERLREILLRISLDENLHDNEDVVPEDESRTASSSSSSSSSLSLSHGSETTEIWV